MPKCEKKILINLTSQGILNLAKVQMLAKISGVKFFEKISVRKSPMKAYAYTQTKLFSIANVLRAAIELIILKRTGKHEKGILFKIKLTSRQKYPKFVLLQDELFSNIAKDVDKSN